MELWSQVLSSQSKVFYFGHSSLSSPSAQCYWNTTSSISLCCSVTSANEYDQVCSSANFFVTSWIHISIQFNPVSSRMKLSINGTLVSTTTLKSGIPGRSNSDSLYFTQWVKEFRIWIGILSDSELYLHYINGPTMNLCK